LPRRSQSCRRGEYARQLFAALCTENSVPDFARYEDIFEPELPEHEQERRFVNEFISEVQRFIEFLLSCKGFEIL
jgi:hypothetical protein